MDIRIKLQPHHIETLRRMLVEVNDDARRRGERYDETSIVAAIVEHVLDAEGAKSCNQLN